jgi:molybdenum cofactor cytidylyltransferase
LRIAGETLIHRAARLALESGFAPVFVVVGKDAELMRSDLTECAVRIVENTEWQAGMSTSLRLGIEAVLVEQARASHLLVLVCDQPQLNGEILRELRIASAAHPDRIVASHYAGTLGVPAIFPAAYFNYLLAVKGDRGARQVIEQFRHHAVTIEFPQGGIDIDTPGDAAKAGLT